MNDMLILVMDTNTGETVATLDGETETLNKDVMIELLGEVIEFLRREPSVLDEEENEHE
ncbi:hypothetical protein [Enterococcus phage Phi_Eg_SY1]|nr:hypothetical protein [Enterococcus phage Phi_Eg_SY1]